jgi:tRNA (adenine57-N1/adenine58-N1)-methyltransferase catalytic subunit
MKSDSFHDIIRKFKRGPQIITRKDAASIAGETGLRANWNCLDLGGGSGFLSLFLANLLSNGKMTIYEIKKEHVDIIKENIEKSGLTNVKVINKPGEEFKGKNYDLITVDMRGAENVVEKCFGALKDGGFLCVYSPHIEQQIAARATMEKAGFKRIKTIENVQREWKIDTRGFSHPIPSQVVHTGYITFARKE